MYYSGADGSRVRKDRRESRFVVGVVIADNINHCIRQCCRPRCSNGGRFSKNSPGDPLRTSTHTRIVVGVVLSRFSWHIKLWRAGCRPRASRCSMWSLFEELSPGDPFCGDRLLDAAPSTRGAGVAVACGSNPRRDSRSAALVATLIHTGKRRR